MSKQDILALRQREIEALRERVRDVFKFPPLPSKLMSMLMTLSVVSTEMLRKDREIADNVKVPMYRLRAALTQYEVKIHSRRGVGYWIDAIDKERIKKLMEE